MRRLYRMQGFGLLMGVLVLAGCARIKPDETGVRTINFGMGEGIVQQDYEPGLHRFLWPLDTWNRFPSTIQKIRFAVDSESQGPTLIGGIEITSADGDRVLISAEVLFRIAEGQAYHVLQESGPGDRYMQLVGGLSLDAARVLFGRMHTEAFYDPKGREAARQEAVALLKERLKPRGIELIDLLILSIDFDSNYENLIKQKKLADQRVELEKAKSRAAEEKGKVDKLKAETVVKVQKVERESETEIARRSTEVSLHIGSMRAEADKYAASLMADANLYKAQKEADGQRLMKTAEAEGSKRLNEALIGEGGRNLVALNAVTNLNLPDVTFPSAGIDWFNPRDMAIRLGAGVDTNSGDQSDKKGARGK